MAALFPTSESTYAELAASSMRPPGGCARPASARATASPCCYGRRTEPYVASGLGALRLGGICRPDQRAQQEPRAGLRAQPLRAARS